MSEREWLTKLSVLPILQSLQGKSRIRPSWTNHVYTLEKMACKLKSCTLMRFSSNQLFQLNTTAQELSPRQYESGLGNASALIIFVFGNSATKECGSDWRGHC